uniref:Uncharacterized protein n=1 Tax=Arundo donax TaxID=35708 RepID=A0A0A9HIL3_ARUDO
MFFWNFAVFLSAKRLEVVCPYKSHHLAYIDINSYSYICNVRIAHK